MATVDALQKDAPRNIKAISFIAADCTTSIVFLGRLFSAPRHPPVPPSPQSAPLESSPSERSASSAGARRRFGGYDKRRCDSRNCRLIVARPNCRQWPNCRQGLIVARGLIVASTLNHHFRDN